MSPPAQPTVEEMKRFNETILRAIRAYLGPRSSAILMIGMPIADSEHDRFAALSYGPCLSTRGLLAWGTPEIEKLIDAGDTSRNGKGCL